MLIAVCGTDAWAQAQGLRLQRSIGNPPQGQDELPAFVIADRLEGSAETELRAIGNAELRRGSTSLAADRIHYLVPDDEAEATGNVRLRVGGDEMTGPRLRLRLSDTTGIFESPSFQLAPREISANARSTEARGDAEALRFDGAERYRISDGRFTTCKPGQDDWFVNARELELDFQREVGTARGANVSFLGVDTPRIPWFDFSLNNQRKSGFLPPTVGIARRNGFEFALPFYWNIAPEYDATITPRFMERRGLQLLNEFRYLQPTYRGEARAEFLPDDKVAERDRWAYTILHNYVDPRRGLSGYANIQRASDDSYFRDLSSRLAVATQSYLPSDVALTYGSGVGGLWNVTGRMQKWQTLQDPQNPVQEPYDRVPQFTANYIKQVVGGFDVAAFGEYVDFDTDEPGLAIGRRAIAYPSLSLPLIRPEGFLTPKIGYHYTAYDLDRFDNPLAPDKPSRGLPIASVDGGLFYERDTTAFGRDFLQTLEPRAYYLYVPYRDQNDIPLFDTSVADFNYAQIFSENFYSGPDRISDANQLTLAVTSRLILPANGQEILRGILGQRYYFQDQRVPLTPGGPTREGVSSPFIVGLFGRIARDWTADATVQYAFAENTTEDGLQRANVGVRYSPAIQQIVNLGYRYTAPGIGGVTDEIRQVDFSFQWPLGSGVSAVGRYNYDLEGGQATEVLGGLEYNAGCWIVRAVAQSFVTATDTRTNVFFLQLELNGFSRFGSNPLEALRRNIPGYSASGRGVPGARPFEIDPARTGGAGAGVPYGGTSSVPYDY